MKKTIVLSLVVLLLMSSMAAAGFWDRITGAVPSGLPPPPAVLCAGDDQCPTGKICRNTRCVNPQIVGVACNSGGDDGYFKLVEQISEPGLFAQVNDHLITGTGKKRGWLYIDTGEQLPEDQISIIFRTESNAYAYGIWKEGETRTAGIHNFNVKVLDVFNSEDRTGVRCAKMIVAVGGISETSVGVSPGTSGLQAQPAIQPAKKPGLFSKFFKKTPKVKPEPETSTKPEEKPGEKKPSEAVAREEPSAEAVPGPAVSAGSCDVPASEYLFLVGDTNYFNGKKVKLENVGSSNAVVVKIEGVTKAISSGSSATFPGTGLKVLVSSVVSRETAEGSSALLVISCASSETTAPVPTISGVLSECKVYTLPSSLTIDMTGSKYCSGKGYSLCVLQMKGANLADCSNTASGTIVCCK